MLNGIKNWSYYQKIRLAEGVYLFILCVFIPLAVGLQLFDRFSFTLSLILLSILQLPTVLLFYRWLLPKTLFNKKPWWFIASLPFYLLLYEINARLAFFLEIHLPFIPTQYRENLASVHHKAGQER